MKKQRIIYLFIAFLVVFLIPLVSPSSDKPAMGSNVREDSVEGEDSGVFTEGTEPDSFCLGVKPVITDEEPDADSRFSIKIPEGLEKTDPEFLIPAPAENIDPSFDGSDKIPDTIIVVPDGASTSGVLVDPNEMHNTMFDSFE